MRFPVRLALSVLLSAVSLFASAQSSSATDPAVSNRFAAESVVFNRSESVYTQAADGTGVHEQTVVVKLQSEAALRAYGVLTLGFASASEHIDIVYARVRRPDGTVLETPVTDAIEQPQQVTVDAPFYSDLKQKQLPIKNLRVGDTLEWKARTVRTRAEALNQFWGQETFQTDLVTLQEVVELRVPATTHVTVWTNPSLTVKPVESTQGAQHVYRWETFNTSPTTGKDAELFAAETKKKLLTPGEELDAEQGKLPSVAWTTFPDWPAVGAWYRSLEAGRDTPNDRVKAKALELTAGKQTEEEKVRAVYAFVSTQFRYIGVAFGVGRFQPHHAEDVLDNQYGDCKDKHTLLAAMLIALGLHPDSVLIGSGIRFNPDVPSPAAFNHLITHVEVAGKPVWLDSTAEVAPYRVLSYPLRDRHALVVPDTAPASIVITPADLPFASFSTLESKGTLDKDGTALSRIVVTVRGDTELLLREVVHQVPPAQYGKLAETFSQSMGYAGTTSNPSISRPEDTAEPFSIAYDYRREKSGDWDHTRILPQLAPVGLPVLDEKTPPVASIQLGVPRTETSHAELTLPPGWTAQLPASVHQKASFASYDLTYRFEKGVVYATRSLTILEPRVPAANWTAYKTWVDGVAPGQENYIQLFRGAGVGDAAHTDLPADNPRAAELIRNAFDAMDAGNFSGAANLLDTAKSINSRQRDLEGAYGALKYDRGDRTGAIPFYHKELAQHPESTWVYSPLIRAQLAAGHRDDALQTGKVWAALEPAKVEPVALLAGLQLQQGGAAEAVRTVTAALPAIPEDAEDRQKLLMVLAKAQFQAGLIEEGATTSRSVLASATDPTVQNNLAYLLADNQQELALAESSARAALTALAQTSRDWTLNEDPKMLVRQTSLTISLWDTLGWALFRQHKYEEARGYLASAWLDSPKPELGRHLGDLELAQANPSAAATAYTLALVGYRRKPLTGSPEPKVDEQYRPQSIEEALARARQAGGTVSNEDPAKQLVALRTVALGPANGKHGASEYRLLLSHAHVEKAQATGSDKPVPGGAELIRTLNPAPYVPAEGDARIVRTAILNCHADVCELVFEP